MTGLVDWESASVGPRSMDVAHCRFNRLYEGLEAAEVFRREWERHTGRTFHRWADIATIIGLLDSERRNPPAHHRRFDIETMLQRAVHAINGTSTSASPTRPEGPARYIGDSQNWAPGNRRSGSMDG